jgi:hypothetical protein
VKLACGAAPAGARGGGLLGALLADALQQDGGGLVGAALLAGQLGPGAHHSSPLNARSRTAGSTASSALAVPRNWWSDLPHALLYELNLLLGESIQLVDQAIDLAVSSLDLALDHSSVIRSSGLCQPLMQDQYIRSALC